MRTVSERRATRAIWLPIVAAIAFAGLTSLPIWIMRNELPARIAQHWDAAGKPDGWTTPQHAAIFAAVTPLIGVFFLGLGILVKQRAMTGALATGMSFFLAEISGGSTLMQHPRAPFSDNPLAILPVALLLAMAIGIGTFALLRQPPSSEKAIITLSNDAPRLAVTDETRVAWSRRTRIARAAAIVIGSGIAVLIAMGSYFIMLGSWETSLSLLILLIADVILLATMKMRIIVDTKGVRGRALGITFVHIPLAQIEVGSTQEISPFTDFGGWGYRVNTKGEGGIITAAGPALRIQRAGAPDFLITIDGADEAMKTLNTLIERRNGISNCG